MILFFRAWLKNTNISPECDIRMQRVSILSKGKISGSEYVLRLKRVFAGGVEDLSALSLVKVVDTDPNLPSEFVLSEPLIIPAGSNIEFTIRAINPKDNKTGPDIVSISPTDIVQRDSLDRMVEWGLSEPFGPTSTVVY